MNIKHKISSVSFHLLLFSVLFFVLQVSPLAHSSYVIKKEVEHTLNPTERYCQEELRRSGNNTNDLSTINSLPQECRLLAIGPVCPMVAYSDEYYGFPFTTLETSPKNIFSNECPGPTEYRADYIATILNVFVLGLVYLSLVHFFKKLKAI